MTYEPHAFLNASEWARELLTFRIRGHVCFNPACDVTNPNRPASHPAKEATTLAHTGQEVFLRFNPELERDVFILL